MALRHVPSAALWPVARFAPGPGDTGACKIWEGSEPGGQRPFQVLRAQKCFLCFCRMETCVGVQTGLLVQNAALRKMLVLQLIGVQGLSAKFLDSE